LRAEVAASNEKLARQALHFTNEMRRMGAGSMPIAAAGMGAQGDRGGGAGGDTRTATGGRARSDQRRWLSDRIADPRQRQMQASSSAGMLPGSGTTTETASQELALKDRKDRGTSKAAELESLHASNRSGAEKPEKKTTHASAVPTSKSSKDKVIATASPSSQKGSDTDEKPAPPAKRGGLLDRITRMDGSK